MFVDISIKKLENTREKKPFTHNATAYKNICKISKRNKVY